jgi:hypothetical protein
MDNAINNANKQHEDALATMFDTLMESTFGNINQTGVIRREVDTTETDNGDNKLDADSVVTTDLDKPDHPLNALARAGDGDAIDVVDSKNDDELWNKFGKFDGATKEAVKKQAVIHSKENLTNELVSRFYENVVNTATSAIKKIDTNTLKKIVSSIPNNINSFALFRAVASSGLQLDDDTLNSFKDLDKFLNLHEKIYGDIYKVFTDNGIDYFWDIVQRNDYNREKAFNYMLENSDKLPSDMFISEEAKSNYLKQIQFKSVEEKDSIGLEETLTAPSNVLLAAGIQQANLGKTGIKFLEVQGKGTKEFVKKYGLPIELIGNTVAQDSLLISLAIQPELVFSLSKALKSSAKFTLAKINKLIDVGSVAENLSSTVIKEEIEDYVGREAVKTLHTGNTKAIKKLLGTDVEAVLFDKEGKALSNIPVVGDFKASLKTPTKEAVLDISLDIPKKGSGVKLTVNQIENAIDVEDAILKTLQDKGNIVIKANNIEEGLTNISNSLFGSGVKRQVAMDRINQLNNVTKQLMKTPNDKKLIDEYFNLLEGNLEGLFLTTHDTIRSVNYKNIFDTFEDEINNSSKNIVSAMSKDFLNKILSPFVKSPTIKNAMVEIPSNIHDRITSLNKSMLSFITKQYKELSLSDKYKLERLLLLGDRLGAEFNIATIERRFGEKVAQSYKNIRAFFNNTHKILDKEMTNYLKTKGFFSYKGSPVKIVERVSDTEAKVFNIEKGTTEIAPLNKITELESFVKFNKGYVPRIPYGEYSISIVNKKKNKVSKTYAGLKSKSDILNTISKLKVNKKTHAIVVHSINEDPIHAMATGVSGKFDTIDIGTKNDFIDKLIELGVDTDTIADIIVKNGDDVSASVINYFTGITGRAKARAKGNIGRFKHILKQRKIAFESSQIYARILSRYAGFEQIKEKATKDFIKKYRNLLYTDKNGIIDWTRFNSTAPKMKGYLGAKQIQDQLRRWHNIPNPHVEYIANKIEGVVSRKFNDKLFNAVPDKDIRVKLNITPTVDKFNKAMTSLGHRLRFFGAIDMALLQGVQPLVTLSARPEIAAQTLKKSADLVAYFSAKKLGLDKFMPFFDNVAKDFDDLINAGIFSSLLPEEALQNFRFLKYGSLPIVAGESLNRLVAGASALIRAEELGIKKGTQEYYDFIANQTKKYALDMSRFSRRTLSEGILSWNVGQFKRYFSQMTDLFYKEMTPREKYLTGVYMFELFGLNGIPLTGDIKAFYEENEPQLQNAFAQLAYSFTDLYTSGDVKGLYEYMYEQGYIDKDTLGKYIKDYLDTGINKDVLSNIEKEIYIRDVVENANSMIDVIENIVKKEGILGKFSDRFAFGAFFNQMYDMGLLSFTGTLVSGLSKAGAISLKAIYNSFLMDKITEREIAETSHDPDAEPKFYTNLMMKNIYKNARSIVYSINPTGAKIADLMMALGVATEKEMEFKDAWEEIEGFIIYNTKGKPLVLNAGLKDVAKFLLGVDSQALNKEKSLGYKYSKYLKQIDKITTNMAQRKLEYEMAGEFDKAIQMDMMFDISAHVNSDGILYSLIKKDYQKKYRALSGKYNPYTDNPVNKIRLLNLSKDAGLISEEDLKEYLDEINK